MNIFDEITSFLDNVNVISGKIPTDTSNGISTADITVLVVTSPVRSFPSTEMMDRVLYSLAIAGFQDSPVMICCDGYTIGERKAKRCFGKCPENIAQAYEQYLSTLQTYTNVTLVRLAEWGGFAAALRAGLDQVRTKYVLVMPHDMEFQYPVNAQRYLDILEDDTNPVKYLGFRNASTSKYRMKVQHKNKIDLEPLDLGDVELLPLLMWKENPHLCSVEHYIQTVWKSRIHRFKKGNFIEDTLGQKMRASIVKHYHETGSLEKHDFFGTYIVWSDEPPRIPLMYHLDGRSYLTLEHRQKARYEIYEREIFVVNEARKYIQTGKIGKMHSDVIDLMG